VAYAIVGIGVGSVGILYAVNGGGILGAGPVQWSSYRPAQFAEIDGDGQLEILGYVNILRGGEPRTHFAAYDGATGRQLWISPDLGAHAEVMESQLGIVDGRVLYADAGGKLTAYQLADAKPLWSVALGERVRDICAAGPGLAIVVTADAQARQVTLADGSLEPATRPAECISSTPLLAVQADKRSKGVRDRSREREPLPTVPGMKVHDVLRPSGVSLLLGNKSPGTRVPMIAAYSDGAVRWTALVPAGDPLKANEGAVELASADGEQVFALYGMQDSNADLRIAAFSMTDGRRLWDEPVPESDTGDVSEVVAVGDRLLVSHWTYLRVYDRATGVLRYTIGRWR